MCVEIRLRAKYRQSGAGRNKSRTSNNSPSRPRRTALKGEIQAAQAITQANQKVMWLDFATTGNGKIRWMRKDEWDALHT